MSRRTRVALCQTLVLIWLAPALAAAQNAPQVQPADATSAVPGPSRVWVVIGGAEATIRGDCTFCEVEGREASYIDTWSLVADVGVRVNSRMDTGVEAVWVPGTTRDGDTFRTTFLVGVAQFRPWGSQGFFIKGGMGMAFVRSWLFAGAPITQKALAVAIGGGWAFRRDKRLGFQIYGAQHVAALGDFELRDGTLENGMGNFWSLGAAVVLR